MKPSSRKWGPALFFIILIIVAVIAVVAFNRTGSMGIEDRYRQAVGLPADTPEEAAPGISIEGNPVLYGIVLCILLACCFAAYRYLPEKEPEDEPENFKGKNGKMPGHKK